MNYSEVDLSNLEDQQLIANGLLTIVQSWDPSVPGFTLNRNRLVFRSRVPLPGLQFFVGTQLLSDNWLIWNSEFSEYNSLITKQIDHRTFVPVSYLINRPVLNEKLQLLIANRWMALPLIGDESIIRDISARWDFSIREITTPHQDFASAVAVIQWDHFPSRLDFDWLVRILRGSNLRSIPSSFDLNRNQEKFLLHYPGTQYRIDVDGSIEAEFDSVQQFRQFSQLMQ